MAAIAVAAVAVAVAIRPSSSEALPGEPPLAHSSNVELVAHIPGQAAGMNFKDHYAFVSGWSGITVLDIARPADPQVVGVPAAPALRERGRRPLRERAARRERPRRLAISAR